MAWSYRLIPFAAGRGVSERHRSGGKAGMPEADEGLW